METLRKSHLDRNYEKSVSAHFFSADNEDFDREEIATYEEVARLFPRADFRRPVVLVGPPGVGRYGSQLVLC